MTQPPNEPILTARRLHKHLGSGPRRVHVLRGVDLEIRRGEFLAIMGPSGCGKSTLLHVLGLITPADKGELSLLGKPAPTGASARTELRRTATGFVFQRFNLLEVLSAKDNVELSLNIRGCECNGRVDRLFDALHIGHVADHKPGQMSIGEQQRVAVARALAHQPALLLADEPTGNLDSANARDLLEIFRAVNRQEQQTIVMITHSPEAAAFADRTVHMKDGRIVERSEA